MAEALLVKDRDPWWRAMLRSKRVLFGGTVLLLLIVVALFADILAPHDPLDQDILYPYLQPVWADGETDPAHFLGTDNLGRDILSRLMHGARVALIVALAAAAGAGIIGTVLGLLAGYFGRWLDAVISRLVDTWMAFPAVLLSIVLVALIGRGLYAIIIAIVIIDWTRFCRVVRAETMVQRQQDYIASAVTIGLSKFRILAREVLPNVVPLLLVMFTLEMGIAIIVEAILSYVGLSISSDAPTWGSMIQEGRQYVNQAPWLLAFPIGAIVLTVFALNQLGDGLKDALDPVLRSK